MKVQNMTSPNGNKVPNQFVITTTEGGEICKYFQSYKTIIAKIGHEGILLDRNAWNYSRTTAKYRNQFLGETTAETERKIKDGTYKLEDLNK